MWEPGWCRKRVSSQEKGMGVNDCSGLHTHSRSCSYVHTSKEPGQWSSSWHGSDMCLVEECGFMSDPGAQWNLHLRSEGGSQRPFHITLKFQRDRWQPVIFSAFFFSSSCLLCIRTATKWELRKLEMLSVGLGTRTVQPVMANQALLGVKSKGFSC